MQTQFAVETITPSAAAEYLRNNPSNRPVKAGWVNTLAGAMERGEFRLNGEAIKIAADGRLLDGQNRLHAIIKCGRPQQMAVVRGLDPGVFDTLDQGVKRTTADVFSIRGEKHAHSLAAASRSLLALLDGGDNAFSAQYTSQQQERVMDTYPRLRHWVHAHASSKSLKAMATSAFPAVLTLAELNHGELAVDAFLNAVATGVNLPAKHPALLLRERLIEARTNSRIRRLSPEVTAAITIKAWNAYITGRPIGLLRFRPGDEVFPIIK